MEKIVPKESLPSEHQMFETGGWGTRKYVVEFVCPATETR